MKRYGSDGHSIMFMPVSNVVNKYIQKVDNLFSYLISKLALKSINL